MNWGLNLVAHVVSVRKGPPMRMLEIKYHCTCRKPSSNTKIFLLLLIFTFKNFGRFVMKSSIPLSTHPRPSLKAILTESTNEWRTLGKLTRLAQSSRKEPVDPFSFSIYPLLVSHDNCTSSKRCVSLDEFCACLHIICARARRWTEVQIAQWKINVEGRRGRPKKILSSQAKN